MSTFLPPRPTTSRAHHNVARSGLRLAAATIALCLLGAQTALAAKPDGKGGGGSTSPLVAPILTATPASSSGIRLQWTDPNTSENGYEIQRSTSSTYSTLTSLGKNTTFHTDSGLSAGTQYCYRVRATGKRRSTSSFSNIACATTDASSGGDTTAPSVSITSPSSGSTYTTAQTVSINASASDNVGVTQVRFYRGSTFMGSDSTSPYSYGWSVSSSTNGTHSWTARAYDAAGNQKTSSAVSLTVNISGSGGGGDSTAPTVDITNPNSGSTITSAQTVTVNANASDNVGVTYVYFYQNGTYRGWDNSAPYTFGWGVDSGDNGSHNWTARAYDAAGNQANDTINVNVNIGGSTDNTAPSVSITSPSSGSTYTSAQTVTINASASDNVGVTKVEFYDGSTLRATDTTAPYSYAWGVTSSANGAHNWTARAYDAANNARSSSAVTLNVDINTSTASGDHVWSRSFGGSSTSDTAAGMTTVFDAAGNAFVAARTTGVNDFGGGKIGATGNGGAIVKYTANGQHAWSRAWMSSGSIDVTPGGIDVDSNGSVFVAGRFAGTVNFGSGALTSAGGYDMFLLKYTSNGQLLWAKRFGSSGAEYAHDLAVDDLGNVWVAGYIQGTANLGGQNLTSRSGSRDGFLAKYGSSGGHNSSVSFGGTSTDEATGVAIDPNGAPVVSGHFQGSATIGNQSLSSAGSSDIFVAKFWETGQPNWAKRAGGGSQDKGKAIAARSDGSIVVGAEFYGSIAFANKSLTSRGSSDVALLQFSSNGSAQRGTVIGGTSGDAVHDIAVDNSGNIAVTGTFISFMNMNGSSIIGNGSLDVYIAKFSPTGAHLWSMPAGVAWSDYGYGIDMMGNGNVVATGSFYEAINFGGQTLSNSVLGSSDGYVVRLTP